MKRDGESTTRSELKHRLPGYIATGMVILTTTLWTFWGVAEMYYEKHNALQTEEYDYVC